MKRSLGGTYISVEPFHLDAYVAEQVFRYNNRKDSDDFTRFSTCIMGIQASVSPTRYSLKGNGLRSGNVVGSGFRLLDYLLHKIGERLEVSGRVHRFWFRGRFVGSSHFGLSR